MAPPMTPRILTSRSRMVAYANCPRYGWLSYEALGTGLEPIALGLPLVNGIVLHEVIAAILRGQAPEAAIAEALTDYRAQIAARGIAHEDLANGRLVREQAWLLEALVWAWLRVRFPALNRDFELVAVEKEIAWEVDPGPPPIVNQVRCDVLARSRTGGGLYYVEWKSASAGGDEWAKQWEHNTQLLANTLAVEEVIGERCEGVLIEGIIKGRRAVDRGTSSPFQGERLQQSDLCYGYRHEMTGLIEAGYRSAKGWRKIAAYELGLTPREWVETILDADQVADCFAPIPPIRPQRAQLDRWRRQTVAIERERAAKIAAVRAAGETPEALDAAFPMNDEHCFRYWGQPCPFEPLCFGGQIGEDPLRSGLYQPRVPHHPMPPEEPSDAE